MRKIALFVEGQSELIFARQLLLAVFGNTKLSFECFKLEAGGSSGVPYSYSPPDPEVHFQIVNVQGDDGVVSAIRARQQRLVATGYEKILGLRDMYSRAYKKRSPGIIDDNVCQAFIQQHDTLVQSLPNCDRIKICFAIMELEAWFLSMYNLFGKIDPKLSCDYIAEMLGFDLRAVAPEKEFYKPSGQVNDILMLAGRHYDKSKSDVEGITSRMELSDFANAIENGRCKAFEAFCRELGVWS